jgi:hypothetical protein
MLGRNVAEENYRWMRERREKRGEDEDDNEEETEYGERDSAVSMEL